MNSTLILRPKEQYMTVTPCCANCKSNNITYQVQTFGGVRGILVYCGTCGAIISWAPEPKN